MTTFHYGKQAATADPRDLKFSTYRTAAPLPAPPDDWGYDNVDRRRRLGHARERPVGRLRLGGRGARAHPHEHRRRPPGDLLRRGRPVRLLGRDRIRRERRRARRTTRPTGGRTSARRSATAARPGSSTRPACGTRSAPTWRSTCPGSRRATSARWPRRPTCSAPSGSASRCRRRPRPSSPSTRCGATTPGSPNVGGHYVPIVAHRRHIECVTWGRVQPMGARFAEHYIDEAWAIVNPDFLDVNGKNPEGFDMAQLMADLASSRRPAASLAVVQPGRLAAGEAGRPAERGALVQDHVHGHAREQVGEAALGCEGGQERRPRAAWAGSAARSRRRRRRRPWRAA